MSLAVSAGRLTLTPGQIDVATAAERAGGQHFALDLVAGLGQHLHLDGAVVEQHHVADADVVDEVGVVHVHGMLFLAAFAAHGQRELLAGLEIQRHGQVAGADRRPLRIHQNPDVLLAGLARRRG
jgi:hypothetical protein